MRQGGTLSRWLQLHPHSGLKICRQARAAAGAPTSGHFMALRAGLWSGLGSDGGRLNFLSPPAIERGEPGVVTHGRRQKRARPSPTK